MAWLYARRAGEWERMARASSRGLGAMSSLFAATGDFNTLAVGVFACVLAADAA